MKLSEIAERIDKSKRNEDYVNLEKFNYEFNLELDGIEQEEERIKTYWVGNWCCTDTWVGYRMYFFDDKPVAFSIQDARKSDENIKWFSQELALEVKEYLISLILKNERPMFFETCDINEDIGEGFKIYYNGNIVTDNKPIFNGEPAKIVERIRRPNDYGIDQELKIQLQNGEERIVNVRDLDFEYYIK